MKVLKKILKVMGIICLVLLIIAGCVIKFVVNYPEIKNDPKVGKWYRVSDTAMKDSEGNHYHALFRKGSENNVMIYFAGGGVSVDEVSAKEDTYNTKELWPDLLANTTMNMGGIASDVEGSPFNDWTIILFPYATGDFHSGTGEFHYVDTDGKDKILYHNGYNNYTLAMKEIMEKAGIENADTVLVTGYSAGGFATALLSDDIYTNYFPNAENKNVLVDASLIEYDGWKDVAENVWKTPKEISDKLTTNNLTMDSLKALHEKYGDGIHLMFDCSTRDGDLAKVQHSLQNGLSMQNDVDESQGDEFQETLKRNIPLFKEAGVSLFIFDGVGWYDDPRNLTAHTIIATPAVWLSFEEQKQSVAGWLQDAINGELKDYGLNLVNKEYEKTE
ncbi:pectin acetylesterase-family hydrolase [Alloscardovia criceti]|uniref:pectin acetylesterase-family hydrolase n=1 Tax=Alloscardovia criceti TaxID=356828 RepID=UPI0003A41E8C|nr:pectin acetylesterase-family hydrolase [Alloscardovia criceti]